MSTIYDILDTKLTKLHQNVHCVSSRGGDNDIHGPRVHFKIPAADAKHLLEYCFPSHPQTGSNWRVHAQFESPLMYLSLLGS